MIPRVPRTIAGALAQAALCYVALGASAILMGACAAVAIAAGLALAGGL